MTVILLGAQSDIGKSLSIMMAKDQHVVLGWIRGMLLPLYPWDLVLVAMGKVAPVGVWGNQTFDDCMENTKSNVWEPLRLLRLIWSEREPNASVCFMAGSNPNKIMAGYNAYNASKMALLKVCEQLDFETPDVKFFALGPGYVDTKIHNATKEANWPNERIARGNSTPIEKIYDCLKWCISQPKEIVGGRNVCVTDLEKYGPEKLASLLKADQNMFKLRRVE